ncbi:hypothetical protein [Streptomyces sp. S1D4-20]|uniref:hypothetical protein n=1 Tax=Streptomyces sp. S1D4-20 TaxID=2594462 RepID=UPI001163D731|nr:hypothetical protein [Streptomyces sp. S1D4-20]QDN57353.1 hypothetical protein FNV67_20215 [Streptomyces sp. S1D4-20]
MTSRTFTREQLEEIGVPFELGGNDTCATKLASDSDGNGRWTETVRLVFRHPEDGQAYLVRYQVGLTEHQDGIDPWMRYGDTIPALEVEQQPVVVQQWKPVDATRDPGLDSVLPAWEVVYEPGNVSDYLIGYANSEAAAKGAAEAWLRSQKDEVGRLEWVPEERQAVGEYDQWFELVELHDDSVHTGPGLVVRRRVQKPTA